MKKLKSNEIRNMWIEFFKTKNHHYIEPKSLIPVNDKSLLWVNSGVATLKSYFDGSDNPISPRLVNIQKSLRTNDVSNVGLTSRHHTFFEMLGNFSIGDYFKKEAISYAYEFLTSKTYLNMDVNKLYFTVYEKDLEAYEILKNLNIKEENIILAPKSTNFWDMGQGPCGPNCEIFYDRGEEFDFEKIGTDLIKYDYDNNERYIEIWNIVFSQFNNDGNQNYTPLPRKNIDTGAGFERLVSLSQSGFTNFDSDLFLPLISSLEKYSKYTYNAQNYFLKNQNQDNINRYFKIIVDHLRAIIFAISDGAYPSNEGRGYVLRKLIRRAMLFAKKLEIEDVCLHKLVDVVVLNYGEFYTNLKDKQNLIEEVILSEEENFSKTIKQGEKNIIKLINEKNKLSAHDVFVLYDTYGFPFDLSEEIAKEYNIELNYDDFLVELEKQRLNSKLALKDNKAMKIQKKSWTNLNVNTTFVGYEVLEVTSKINAIFDENDFLFEVNVKQNDLNTYYVCFEKTPFYATMGGQEKDLGKIYQNGENIGEVVDVLIGPNKEHIHVVCFKKDVVLNSEVNLVVDESRRKKTAINHSATHLVHQVLFNKLGSNLKQAGSYQDENKGRFDFSVFAKFDKQELQKELELEVNKLILENKKIQTEELTYQKALENKKLFAEFEGKYDQKVRVVSIEDFNFELCGGTHIENTKQIEQIYINSISSKGSNIYRVEFTTTKNSIENLYKEFKLNLKQNLKNISEDLKLPIVEKLKKQNTLDFNFVQMILKDVHELKANIKKSKALVEKIEYKSLTCEKLNGVSIYINYFENKNVNFLRSVGDIISQNDKLYINIVLNKANKNTIIVSCVKQYDANVILKSLTSLLECYGGGKKHMVQGSFVKTANKEQILNIIKEVL